MEGHSGLSILLLFAGIITLASSSTTSPPLTTHPSTVTETNVTLSVKPLNSTQTSTDVPITQAPNVTVTTVANETVTSAEETTTGPAQSSSLSTTNASDNASTQLPTPMCSYTLTPIRFGYKINTSVNSGNGSFHLILQNEMDEVEKYVITNPSSELLDLKPCTNYKPSLSFTFDNTNINCTLTTDKIAMTHPLKSEDLEYVKSRGEICYQSKWNISNHLEVIPSWKIKQDKNMFCIKYNETDICTDFTINISSICNSSFTFTKFLNIDQLDTPNVKMVYPVDLYPSTCKDRPVEYTCSEKEKSLPQNKTLRELEPYTAYKCAGKVTRENVTVWTPGFDLEIQCKLQINVNKVIKSNSSFHVNWTLNSSVCGREIFTNFNFSHQCHSNETTSVHGDIKSENISCQFLQFKPYTPFNYGFTLFYKGKAIFYSQNITNRTSPGKPEKIRKISFSVRDRNNINVNWESHQNFYGSQKRYIVRLLEGGKEKEKRNTSKAKVEFHDLSYSTAYTVEVSAFNGEQHSDPTCQSVSTLWNEKPLIWFLVFLIILTSMALIFVAFKIYILRKKRSRDSTENMILIPKTNDEDRLIFVEPMTAEHLLDAYKMKIADEGRLFLAEFQSIPRIFSKYPVKEAKKNHNVPKNRYVDILPYDYNRVQLTTGNGSTGCDYINASFIDGFKESKKYIAAQGPKEETMSDFWRMIWEQQASIIVMVSRCEEGNRVKCAQYWPSPDRETEMFEEFIVKLTSEDHYPDYIIRHLSLTSKKDKGSEREVTHIQFMSWPDHGVPEEAHLLLKLRRRVNSFKNFFSGPIVIHCSAGVGRTGTYMSIDAMMESLEGEGKADIYGYVVMLRRQRCLMVQVEAQYILIHQALLEHTQFGETESTLQELHYTLNMLRERNGDNEPTLMEEEFDRLPTFKNWRTFNTGIAEENQKRNRTPSVIPYDYNRVLLKHNEGQSHESDPDDDYEMSSDDDNDDNAKYINASLLSGYWGPHAFIATQTPLPHTTVDFWSMILQNEVPAVIMLSDCSQGDQDCIYWGEDKKTFEDIEVEFESTDNCPNFILRNIAVHHSKRKIHHQVKHFQFLKWGNRELPEKPQDLADLIREVKHRCCLTWPRSAVVVVHCNDGSSRSGVLCALWNLLDSAEKEKAVDVFQVVKTLRKERQRMLSSLEQYQFLYDALEVIFPVQNGDVKGAQNSVQIVSETRAAERPASTTSTDQQEAQSADGDVSTATQEASSNGPTITLEV